MFGVFSCLKMSREMLLLPPRSLLALPQLWQLVEKATSGQFSTSYNPEYNPPKGLFSRGCGMNLDLRL